MSIALVLGVVIIIGAFVLIFVPKPTEAPSENLVATTTPTTAEDKKPTGTETPFVPVGGQRVIENGIPVTIIYLTSLGFSPYEITIASGEEVRFVNKTNNSMRIGTRDPESSSFYDTFSQPEVVGRNGEFQIGLTREGIWAYRNLTSPDSAVTGIIYVR